jgi:hypothetical protein
MKIKGTRGNSEELWELTQHPVLSTIFVGDKRLSRLQQIGESLDFGHQPFDPAANF